jgi:hypothetical protein
MYFLPNKHGPIAVQYLELVSSVLANPSASQGLYQQFMEISEAIEQLYEKMTQIDCRDLLYALYPYLWQVKEEVILFKKYASLFYQQEPQHSATAVTIPEFRSKIFRGGFVAELQRLLPFDPLTASFYRPATPIPTSQEGFRIQSTDPNFPGLFILRRATLEDEDAMYEVCLKTGDAGKDASEQYLDKKILGRRCV